jgi:CO dehydrogenase maturation factor
VLLRALLTDVVLYKDDLVILDMEAGLEHLGRATARGVDLMLIVAEPGQRSVETARSIRRMANQIGLERLAVIGNKASSQAERRFLEETFAGWDYLGTLPHDETIRRADREGAALIDIAPPELLEAAVVRLQSPLMLCQCSPAPKLLVVLLRSSVL